MVSKRLGAARYGTMHGAEVAIVCDFAEAKSVPIVEAASSSSQTVCLARVPLSLAQRRASIKIGLSGSCSYSNDPYTRCRVDLTYMDA